MATQGTWKGERCSICAGCLTGEPTTQSVSVLKREDLGILQGSFHSISFAFASTTVAGILIIALAQKDVASQDAVTTDSTSCFQKGEPELLFFSVTEWVGVSYRSKAVLITHCCFAIGQMILAGLAYGIRNWRLLQIAGTAPVFALFFYIWVLPESARWLVIKGRIEEAKKLLQKAAAINKRTLPPELLEQVPAGAVFVAALELSFIPWIWLHVLFHFNFRFADSLVYYGLSLNVSGFGLNVYLTQLAFGGVELPARISCIFLLQWFGRKKTQAAVLLLSGLMSLLLPSDQPVVTTVLAIIGKFTSTASFSTSYVYSAELFPTVVRQTGLGLCSMLARLAGIMAPLLLLLEQYHRAIPMAVFGSVTVVVGLLCFLLPETRGTDLADDTKLGDIKGATPRRRWTLVMQYVNNKWC
uniref:Uncharacterized protein n=1 Tax=Melopsittacus undulatus TaxID=13146 RepID=A0A8C6N8N3_MELUD